MGSYNVLNCIIKADDIRCTAYHRSCDNEGRVKVELCIGDLSSVANQRMHPPIVEMQNLNH